FRRLKCDVLLIRTFGIVNESIVEEATGQIDSSLPDLVFYVPIQPSVVNFALRSKIPVASIQTFSFSIDPMEIFELPWAPSLGVNHMKPGFSDQQFLELAKQGRRELILTAHLSHAATLQHVIEIVFSTRMRRMVVEIETDYFHRFLTSIALVEEEGQLLDVSDPSSPVIWLHIDATDPHYHFDTGVGHVFVFGDHRYRRVDIDIEPTCELLWPTHNISLSRLCPGNA
ncbi:hypothetical protein PFISCL1PPCAC_28445, partial [Pristionchus fissidentatus]